MVQYTITFLHLLYTYKHIFGIACQYTFLSVCCLHADVSLSSVRTWSPAGGRVCIWDHPVWDHSEDTGRPRHLAEDGGTDDVAFRHFTNPLIVTCSSVVVWLERWLVAALKRSQIMLLGLCSSQLHELTLESLVIYFKAFILLGSQGFMRSFSDCWFAFKDYWLIE